MVDSRHLQDIEDWDLWTKKPEYHWVFNKLEIALLCGHHAGPCPALPSAAGYYCVRPIYNLYGMGLHAEKIWLETDDNGEVMNKTHPGSFWCEWFEGAHYSIDYEWDNGWQVLHASQGYNDDEDLSHFYKWQRISPPDIELPGWLNKLANNEVLNIEFKGNKIIEIHLRLGNLAGDWAGVEHAQELIPVWRDTSESMWEQYREGGYKFISKPIDAADGFHNNPRLGFMYR